MSKPLAATIIGVLLATLVASDASAAFTSPDDVIPTQDWQIDNYVRERERRVAMQPTLEKRRAVAKAAMLSRRVAAPEWLDPEVYSEASAAPAVPLAAMTPTVTPEFVAPPTGVVGWLLILGIVAAFSLIVGAVAFEMKRARQKRKRLEDLRLAQVAALDARLRRRGSAQ